MTIPTNNSRVAIVTGAGSASGIGFAVALRLARSGMRVVLTSTTDRILERAAEINAHCGEERAIGIAADLTSPTDAVAIASLAKQAFGRVDVLVNNAGMTSVSAPDQTGSIGALELEDWNRSIERNLSTAFIMTRAVLPSLQASGSGRIVTVASVSGPLLAYRGDIGYHAGKAGLVGMTRALAVDLANSGCTANVVAPGWIATGSATEHELQMGAATPLGRSGTPDEVASMIEYLTSPSASYVTGQFLVVDGGNSIQEEKG